MVPLVGNGCFPLPLLPFLTSFGASKVANSFLQLSQPISMHHHINFYSLLTRHGQNPTQPNVSG